METLETILKDLLKEAKNVVGDKTKLEKLLSDLKGNKKVNELKSSLTDLQTLQDLVKDYLNGTYTKVPAKTIITIVASLLYLLSSKDLIPDCIPNAGIQDDKMAIELCIKQIKNDLEEYKKNK